MIESTTYRCEVCGTVYANRHECTACENYHAKLPNNAPPVVSAHYLSKNAAGLPYPVRMVMRFADGRRAIYDFVADVAPEGR